MLWYKISQKTRFLIAFSTKKLINLASHKIQIMPVVKPVALTINHAQAKLTEAGFGADRKIQTTQERYVSSHTTLIDILSLLQDQTELTRTTLFEIIKRCNRLGEFKANPQGFIFEGTKQIHKALVELLVDVIQYEKLAGEHYKMELFNKPELEAYIDRAYHVQLVEIDACVQIHYDYIEYDFHIEHQTPHALDGAENVKFFCRLPRWFKIPIPVRSYNPDWAAVLVNDKRVYLIRETKSTHGSDKRRLN